MIKQIIYSQKKIKVVSVGAVGPPGPASVYDLMDITITGDGTGTKNIDYGFNANLNYSRTSQGHYLISSSSPVFDGVRVFPVITDNNTFNRHILINYMIEDSSMLSLQCLDFASGGYADCNLAIKIERLKQ